MRSRKRAAVVIFLALAPGMQAWITNLSPRGKEGNHLVDRFVRGTVAVLPEPRTRGNSQWHRQVGAILIEPCARNKGKVLSRLDCTEPSSGTIEHQTPLRGDTNDDGVKEARPFAKVGDVVRYQGKWKEEIAFGEIRQLQRVEQTGEWRAYVLALEDIGDGQYARKKSRKSKAEPLASLRPVRAFYIRSVDGFKIMKNAETGEPRYLSDSYELEGFELPKVVVDPVKFAVDRESYEDLKRRLVLDAASFGAVCALATWQILGVDKAVLVAFGALAAVGYVLLLEKTADDVASGNQDTLTKLQGDLRFAIPVALVAAVALKNYLADSDATKLLSLVPKNDFAAAMLGFLAPSRLPLLYRELRASLTGEDILDMLPGSVGQGRQIFKDMRSSDSEERQIGREPGDSEATRILVISGPKNLGKSALVEALMREDNRLKTPVWCTTRPLRQAEVEGEDFIPVAQVKFEDIERNGGFLRTYKDEGGESYGLRLEDVLAVSEKGKVCVIDADKPLVQSLMEVGDVALIGVWVSLDSLQALENRIRSTLIEGGAAEDDELASKIRTLTTEAVSDIEFGVMSGVFDFTVINDNMGESMETLRRAVEFTIA